MQKVIEKKYFFVFFLINFSIFIFLNTHFLLSNDEVSTMLEMRMPFREMLHFLFVEDVHPPVYFILLKFWTVVFGESVFAARCFSYLGVLLGAFVCGNLVKKLYGQQAGLWFTLLCLFLPEAFWMAKTIRMYSWAFFFCTAAFLYAQSAYLSNRKKDFVFYVLYAFLAAWTHYYATFTCALLALCFLYRSRKRGAGTFKSFFIYNTVLFLLVCPEIYVFLKQCSFQADQITWISMHFVNQAFYSYLSGKPTVQAFAMDGLWIMGFQFLLSNAENEQKNMAKTGLLIAFSVWLIPFVVSCLYRPILVDRYLTVALGCLYVFFLFGIMGEPKNKVMLSVLLPISVLCNVYDENNQIKRSVQSEFYSVFKENVMPEDIIITDNWFVRLWLTYYFPKHDIRILEEGRKVLFFREKYYPVKRNEIEKIAKDKKVFMTGNFVSGMKTLYVFGGMDRYASVQFSLLEIIPENVPFEK